MTPPLVIGYGNTLRGDDAAGVIAAQRIRDAMPGVDVLITHDIQPEIAEAISYRSMVIFLDAAAGIQELVCTQIDVSAPVPPIESHLFSPSQLLALCKTLYGTVPTQVHLIGIPAREFGFAERLTPETEAAIDECVARVRQLLDGSGVD